jgi:hypothetical protein
MLAAPSASSITSGAARRTAGVDVINALDLGISLRGGLAAGTGLGGLGLGEIGAVPPAAAERLEQGGAVGQARGAGLGQGGAGLQLGLFGRQQRQHRGLARVELLFRRRQRALSGPVDRGGGVQGPGVALQRLQAVGHVLEGGQRRAAVLRLGLLEQGLGALLPVLQLAALEDRLGHRPRHGPEEVAAREQAAEIARLGAGVGG